MAMRVEYIGIYRHGVLDQALAEEPKAGPPVENEQVPAASDLDAGRIAAVAADAGCAAGDAAANPPETHADARHRLATRSAPALRQATRVFMRLSLRGEQQHAGHTLRAPMTVVTPTQACFCTAARRFNVH